MDKLLRLAENIGLDYKEALPAQKRNYLTIFFKKFEVSKGKIVKYHLSSDLKELIENGSVRVRTTGLALVDYVGTWFKNNFSAHSDSQINYQLL